VDLQNTYALYVNGIVEPAMNIILGRNWSLKGNLTLGSKNIIKKSLIPIDKVILPLLRIKLGLVKQFVKAMKTTESKAFMYIFEKFPKISDAKIKEGILGHG